MSNRATLQPCKFVNISKDGEEEEVSYGFRLYDDYGQTYTNVIDEDEFLKDIRKLEPVALIKKYFCLTGEDSVADAILDGVIEKGGMYWNDSWIEFKKEKTHAEQKR
jgi:hypothetical protein